MNKKLLIIPALISLCALALQAESLLLKNGTIVSGSILDQSEYVLNLQTKYGVIAVPQRNIVEIMPDQHKVLLKGGGEVIGIIEDIDQFNIRLKTDKGYVNVDMNKVASVDVYDYEQAANQQKFIEEQIKEAQQKEENAAQPAAVAPGGIAFDDDIDRIFAPKAPAQVEYIPIRNTPSTNTAAVAAPVATEVYSTAVKTEDIQSAVVDTPRIGAQEHAKKETQKRALTQAESNSKKYLAVEVGALDNTLKLGENEVGGIGVAINIKYLWRLGKSNLWLGPSVAASVIPGETITEGPISADYDGQLFHLGVTANYYITPNLPFQTYVTASAGLETISLDGKITDTTDPDPNKTVYSTSSASSSGFLAGLGLGVERRFGDTSIGIEGKVFNSSRGGDLKDSDSMFYSVMAKLSWKF